MDTTTTIPQALKEYHPAAYHAAVILNLTGGRISEVLSILRADVSPDGVVFIQGLKNSRSYTLFYPALLTEPCFINHNHPKIFGTLDRVTVYRAFLKFGIQTQIKGNKRRTVTHTFRHKKAQWLKSINKSQKAIQDAIGHNSIKSQVHYIRNYDK